MPLLPEFGLGLWNAWIFMVPSLLLMLLSIRLFGEKRAPAASMRMSRTKLSFCLVSKFIYFAAVAYSFFLPLKLGTTWFYAGLPLTLAGLVGSVLTVASWAGTPAGEMVTKGIYRFSRHPILCDGSLASFRGKHSFGFMGFLVVSPNSWSWSCTFHKDGRSPVHWSLRESLSRIHGENSKMDRATEI